MLHPVAADVGKVVSNEGVGPVIESRKLPEDGDLLLHHRAREPREGLALRQAALVVARKNSSRIGALQELSEMLGHSPANVAGVIVNEF